MAASSIRYPAEGLSQAQIDKMVRVHAARAQVVPAQEAVYRATLQLEAAQQAVPPHPATIAAAMKHLAEAEETAKQVYIQYNNEVVESKRMGLVYRVRDLEYESGRLAGLPSEATRNAVQYMKNIRDQPGSMSSRLHMPPLQALLGMSYNDFSDYTEKMADRLHKISAANREEAEEAQRQFAQMHRGPESHLQPGMGGAFMRRMKVKRTRSKKCHKNSKKYAYSRKRIHRRKY